MGQRSNYAAAKDAKIKYRETGSVEGTERTNAHLPTRQINKAMKQIHLNPHCQRLCDAATKVQGHLEAQSPMIQCPGRPRPQASQVFKPASGERSNPRLFSKEQTILSFVGTVKRSNQCNAGTQCNQWPRSWEKPQ